MLRPAQILKEIEVQTYRVSGPGGQHRNKVETAVRIKHLPTGIVVTAKERRSQVSNRKIAFRRLIAKLREREVVPPKRRPTRPTAGSVHVRSQYKRIRSERKRLRRGPASEE